MMVKMTTCRWWLKELYIYSWSLMFLKLKEVTTPLCSETYVNWIKLSLSDGKINHILILLLWYYTLIFSQGFWFVWRVLAGLFYFSKRNVENVILDSEWMNLIKQCFSLFQTGKKCRTDTLTFYLISIILPVNVHSQWICKLQNGIGN